MTRAAGDALDAGDRFVLCLVRQHRAFAAIADGTDAFNIGAEFVVGGDAAP